MSRLRIAALLASLSLSLVAFALGAARAVTLERNELEEHSELRTLGAWAEAEHATSVSARLLSVPLRRDDHASFEVCSEHTPPDAALRSALSFVVWRPKPEKLELRVPLDDKFLPLLKRRGDSACLVLGGGTIEHEDLYALDVVWGKGGLPRALAGLSLRARALVKQPLGRYEGLLVAAAALGMLGAALSLYVARPGPVPSPGRRAAQVVVAAVLAATLVFIGLLYLPLPSAAGGLVRGTLVAVDEVGVALLGAWLLYGVRLDATEPGGGLPRARARRLALGLGLTAPFAKPGPLLLVAPALAAVLGPAAHAAMALVPSTGEAPLEAFIAWPSGALTFALIGMTVPVAEELFFRGFLYGALRVHGAATAFLASVLLFALAHAQQSFGNWGALLAVTVTGVAMTSARALTGSTLVPVVAHLLYNASLWRSSFGG